MNSVTFETLLFTNHPHPMWIYDLETLQFLRVNHAAVTRYGYTEEEFLSMRITDIRPEADVPALLAAVQQDRAQRNVSEGWRHRRKDGKIFNVRVTSNTISYQGRDAVLVVAEDITEQKRTIAGLKQSRQQYKQIVETVHEGIWMLDAEQQFRLIVEAMPNAIVVVDQTGEIVLVNAQSEALFGYDREELIGRPVDMLVPARFRHAHADYRDGFTVAPEARKMGKGRDLYTIRKDGTEVPVEIGLSPMRSHDELLILAAVVDITERKKVEKSIRQLNEELEKRVATRTVQLEAANKELESFAYSVSHDLRAPLRAMDGFSRILLEDFADETADGAAFYLKRIRSNAQQMGELIDGLLDFSRLNRQDLRKQQVRPATIVQKALEPLRDAEADRDVTITIGELPPCEADPRLLTQVFSNLLSNALKYTRSQDAAHIVIGAEEQNGNTVYYVQDNGIGFDAQYADKVFGVFQRLNRAEQYEGTGVGLATVQRIIHRHGGKIWVEAAVDEGATFYFTLA